MPIKVAQGDFFPAIVLVPLIEFRITTYCQRQGDFRPPYCLEETQINPPPQMEHRGCRTWVRRVRNFAGDYY
jgi:hypothetical protein